MIPTVTAVVRGASQNVLGEAFRKSDPYKRFDLEIDLRSRNPVAINTGCTAGEEFHAELSSAIQGNWVSYKYWPYVQGIRDWLSREGVTWTLGEWEFRFAKAVRGKCDLLVKGGVNGRGVIEAKLVKSLPEAPPCDDRCQLGLYVCAAADRHCDYHHYWGALAYVCPRRRTIRIYRWRSMKDNCHAARQVLRAA